MARYDEKADEIVLSTGKRVYTVLGALSMAHDLEPRYGFDGSIEGMQREKLTPAEWQELADLAISYWAAFKAKVGKTP